MLLSRCKTVRVIPLFAILLEASVPNIYLYLTRTTFFHQKIDLFFHSQQLSSLIVLTWHCARQHFWALQQQIKNQICYGCELHLYKVLLRYQRL